jgi:excisionase family DNA binding protein
MKNIELYTVKETARLLRISERTVFNYLKQGLIKPIRIGGTRKAGKTLIPAKEIEKLLRGEH